ncbi:MAG: TIGR02679 family protein [Pseudonocardiaceae bacterium]|nr:TIGR02679 family protein [Pseudonocardiaceae bacterium]
MRSEALRPLWQAVHYRLSSGQPVTRVRVGPLDGEQRAAVADLLGMARYPGEYANVTLSKLDDILRESIGMDARVVVTEALGPLGDRAARRASASEQRAALWEWLATNELVIAQPALREWVEQVRRAGIVNGSVSATRQLLESALLVLRRLPTQGDPLPAFAESVLDDPHALDDGTRLSGLVLRALAAIYGTEVPGNAEQRRALWERAGIADDELSTVVVAAGLRPTGTGLSNQLLRICAESGHPAAVTLGQLRADPELSLPSTDVWVVENPSVLALARRQYGANCPPLVCTSGWPNGAAILLLRKLAVAGARLRYHGDLDGEGIRIAAYVLDKTGARPWRMSAADYLDALRQNPRGPDPGRVTEAPWDTDLAEAMRQHRTAVVEERVAGALLRDVAAHSPVVYSQRQITPSDKHCAYTTRVANQDGNR